MITSANEKVIPFFPNEQAVHKALVLLERFCKDTKGFATATYLQSIVTYTGTSRRNPLVVCEEIFGKLVASKTITENSPQQELVLPIPILSDHTTAGIAAKGIIYASTKGVILATVQVYGFGNTPEVFPYIISIKKS